MSITDWFEIAVYFAVLLGLAIPLGAWMARVLEGQDWALSGLQRRIEYALARLCGYRTDEEMTWQRYALAVLLFNGFGIAVVFALQVLQDRLPLNPNELPAVPAHLAFNTAVSFVTNTNWQAYSGEVTLSVLTQMLGLAVQNFVSAATGIAVLIALVRGLKRQSVGSLGSFWTDLVRATTFVLLPMSVLMAMVLVSQGVVQTFRGSVDVALLESLTDADGNTVTTQTIPLGPAASQVAIKQLGTNGGGFYGVNSAHPLENPTPLSNFIQLLAILLIPAALCETFGRLLNAPRQGRVLLAAMLLIFVPCLLAALLAEQQPNATLAAASAQHSDAGRGLKPVRLESEASTTIENMEGKETRFRVSTSVLWAVATTAASNGSVNSMHDSLTPLGGLIPMWLMQVGEVVFGGVGCGLYGMIIFAIVAVFISGLMVGRTPEYLGKKIEAFEMKMAALVILIPSFVVLGGAAVSVMTDAGRSAVTNPGPHGFSQILYAWSSAGNNNGSAFAGLRVNTPFWNVMLGVAMLVSRFGLIVPVLAIAGSLGRKVRVPAGTGTLPTVTPLFAVLLAGIVVLVGALTFVPALVLGPVAEHLAAAR